MLLSFLALVAFQFVCLHAHSNNKNSIFFHITDSIALYDFLQRNRFLDVWFVTKTTLKNRDASKKQKTLHFGIH